MNFNYERTKEISYELGIGEFYKYLPVVLMYRTMDSNKKIGENFTQEERKELRERNMVSLEKINNLMNALPPDMLFIIRASNLVAIHNRTLGGTSRERLLKFSDLVIENLHPNSISRVYYRTMFYVKLFLFESFKGVYSFFYK